MSATSVIYLHRLAPTGLDEDGVGCRCGWTATLPFEQAYVEHADHVVEVLEEAGFHLRPRPVALPPTRSAAQE
jgi:hypothetical protein